MKVLVSGIKHSKVMRNTPTSMVKPLQVMLLDEHQSVYALADINSKWNKLVNDNNFDAAIHLAYPSVAREYEENSPRVPEFVYAGIQTLASLANRYRIKKKMLLVFDESSSSAMEGSDACASWIRQVASFCDSKGVALIVRSVSDVDECQEIGEVLRERMQSTLPKLEAPQHEDTGLFNLPPKVDELLSTVINSINNSITSGMQLFQKQIKRLWTGFSGLYRSPVNLVYHSGNPLLRERSPMLPPVEVHQGVRVLKESMDQNAPALGGWIKKVRSMNNFDNKVFRDLEYTLPQLMDTLYGFLEPALISLPFVLTTYYLQKNYFLQLDFLIVYIVMINAYYGWHTGGIAVILSSLGYTWLRVSTENVSIFRLLRNPNHMLYLTMYLLVGVTVGLAIDYQRRERESLVKEKESLQQELAQTNDLYLKSLEVKDVLQKSIENYENSLGKIYTIVSRLENAIPEQIFEEAANVFAEMLKAKSVHIYYSKSSMYYRLAAFRGPQKYPRSLTVEDFTFIQSVIEEQKTFTNQQLNRYHPMVSAPIVFEGQLTSLVFLDGMPFTQLTQQYLNTLTVICRLVSSAVLKAAKYEDAIHHKKYHGDTFIMKAQWFNRLIAEKQEPSTHCEDNVYLLEFMKNGSSHDKIFAKVSPLIRFTDYIGELDRSRYAILLTHVNEEEVAIIESRLTEKGIVIAEKEVVWGTA